MRAARKPGESRGDFTSRIGKRLAREQTANLLLRQAATEALNALRDYVPQLEAHGASLHYGRSVMRLLEAALAAAEAAD